MIISVQKFFHDGSGGMLLWQSLPRLLDPLECFFGFPIIYSRRGRNEFSIFYLLLLAGSKEGVEAANALGCPFSVAKLETELDDVHILGHMKLVLVSPGSATQRTHCARIYGLCVCIPGKHFKNMLFVACAVLRHFVAEI